MSITPYVPPTNLSSLPTGIWSGTQGLPVLPYLPGQTPTVKKSPEWATNRQRASSGRERRQPMWNYPLWNFELQYEVIRHKPTKDELFTMWEFFNVLQGQYAPFLFVDPSDCQVLSSAPASFGTGDGATRTFQLMRQINSFSEPVYDVYPGAGGALTVNVAGTPTAAYTIAPNGLLTFTSAPAAAAVLTWSGYWYYGCAFQDDTMEFEQMVQLLWSGASVKFQSLRA